MSNRNPDGATGLRRVVTGHDANGKAVILSDGPTPTVISGVGLPGLVFHEMWEMAAVPTPIAADEAEPTDHDLRLAPPSRGVRIRINDIPPEGSDTSKANALKVFESLGASGAHDENAPHPLMHRTETVDFAIVLEGEMALILDDGETLVKAGDVVVQRGTNHAWANRSGKQCRVAFILVDGAFDPSLATHFA